MNRRSFLSFGGLFAAPSIFIGGAAASTLPKEDISHLAPIKDNTSLQLFNQEKTGKQNSVLLTVGKDNRLWIKVDDKWERVAIEP